MNIKKAFGTLALASLIMTAGASAADNHDIILGIRTEASGDNDILINLGDFSTFASSGTQFLGNYNTFLTAQLGANWNNLGTNFWSIAGANTTGTRVVYAGNSGAAYLSMTAANVNGGSSAIGSVYSTITGLTAGQGAFVADSDVSGWTVKKGPDVFGMPNSKVDGAFFEQATTFGGGILSTHLTRVTGSGVWTDLGTISFASNGDVSFVSAVPEPSTYGLMGAGALAAVAAIRRRRNKIAVAKVA